MYFYAQLNNENIVVGISQLSGEVLRDDMIDITDFETAPELGSRYDPETESFEAPDPMPEPEPTIPVEQIAEETLLETKYQTLLLEMMI